MAANDAAIDVGCCDGRLTACRRTKPSLYLSITQVVASRAVPIQAGILRCVEQASLCLASAQHHSPLASMVGSHTTTAARLLRVHLVQRTCDHQTHVELQQVIDPANSQRWCV